MNGFGISNPSNIRHVEISTTPTAPLKVGVRSGHQSFTAHWTKPASDGGRTISSYLVEYSTCVPDSPHCSFSERSVSGSKRSATIGALSGETKYYVRVVAVNSTGASLPSHAVKVTTKT